MNKQENEPRSLLARIAKAIGPLVHHTWISTTLAFVGALVPFIYKLSEDDADTFLPIIIVIVAAYFALNILTDRITRTLFDIEISVVNLTVQVMQLTITERISAAKEIALSLTYLGKLKEKHSDIKLALLICSGVLALFSVKFPALDLLNLAAVSIAVLGLIVLKEAVVEYRIRNGFFGTTRGEARELIDFILKNSDDIDFTDGNGNLRKMLLPETSKNEDLKAHLTPGGATI